MAVPEHLIEEFLLRLPPTDPTSLVRAALVCKPWSRLISSRRFRRRFCKFHRTPPMLGFLANTIKGPRFVSTSSFRPPSLAEYRGWQVLDARHSRVLLRSMDMDLGSPRLVVWCPVMNEWQKLPLLSRTLSDPRWNAAVLCAASGSASCDCDHLDCQRGGPFLVVLVAAYLAQSTLRIYSSESCAWSEPRPLPSCSVNVAPIAVVGTTLYFSIDRGSRILGYDLATREAFVFSLPRGSAACDHVLMTTEDGGLGVALLRTWVPHPSSGFRVGVRHSLWSMETDTDGDIGWTKIRVIEKLLPVMSSTIYPGPIAFPPGLFFFNTVDGLFSINLISEQLKKELDNDEVWVIKALPHMSFYTPGLTITDEGPAVDAFDA